LDLCLRKPRSGKSQDYRDAIVFVFRPQENEKPAFSNSSGLKSAAMELLFQIFLA